MNRIVVADDIKCNLNDAIIKEDELVFNIKKDTKLELEINNPLVNIIFNIEDNVELNIINLSYNEGKVLYTYNLGINSKLNLTKLNDTKDIKEKIIFNLNGSEGKVNYVLKTISSNSEYIEVLTYHNASKTESNIINHGVNIDSGNLVFNVSSFIPKGIKGCIANQKNRIINLTNNKCIINPNLFIDEEDVIANHSAYLGLFSDEEMFYIESRGINYKDTLNLLIKGFLVSNIEEEDVIKKIEDKMNMFGGE